MDLEHDPLMNFLFPKDSSETLESSITENSEFVPYLSYLCSCGVDQLSRQHDSIVEEKAIILSETKKLATENYQTFIKSSDCIAKINDKFSEIDQKLVALDKSIPEFNQEFKNFSEEVNDILKQKRSNNQTLAKHNQLLETLEITQLMDTCVRNHYYDEALELGSYVKRLEKRLDYIPLIKGISQDVDRLKKLLLQQLFLQLRGNVQLPVCLKLIGYLRRMNVYQEDQLRMKFLQARGSWLRNILKAVPNSDPYEHITRVIELNRIHLFDIVTQYRALFSSEEQIYFVAGSNANRLKSIFNSWILHKINEFLNILRNDLMNGAGARIESVLNQAMYFGLSFSRIGGDFRMLMLPIFIEVVIANYRKSLDQITDSFKNLLAVYTFAPSVISTNTIVQPLQQTGVINPPAELILYPPLSWLCNEIIPALNDLRICCPISSQNEVVNLTHEFIRGLSKILAQYYANEKATMTQKESKAFHDTCIGYRDLFVPFAIEAPLKLFKSNNQIEEDILSGLMSEMKVILREISENKESA